jgi:hypothetical protein
LRLISRLLQLRGFDVTPVPDGGAALNALITSFRTAAEAAAAVGEAELPPPASSPFDLALLDMEMVRAPLSRRRCRAKPASLTPPQRTHARSL